VSCTSTHHFLCLPEALLSLSHSCVLQIQNSKKKTGVIPPKKFVARLKRDNELFRSYMHQVGTAACDISMVLDACMLVVWWSQWCKTQKSACLR
jgi:hypothetical protein